MNLNLDEAASIQSYLTANDWYPRFFCGDALEVLATFPTESIDFCMTSPPYWNKREYANGGIGLEANSASYLHHLTEICAQIHRVLKKTGSFWLNLGDSYQNKGLASIPWRVALALIDQQGWILRNDVVWNKIKGFDNSKDKLRNTHEYLFHFVKQTTHFYYDDKAIRTLPRQAKVKNGAVISATGVTGVRYKRQIELSTALNNDEKIAALAALETMLARIEQGEIADFRMVIRRQQRTTHSDSQKLSGRAKELAQKGFYFLIYHPDGAKIGDVWDIVPEDTSRRTEHYAAYPEDLCKIPILATCPPDGIVLDPFCGTGTTNLVAMKLGRKSIGIDISPTYIESAKQRCGLLL